MPQSEKGKFKFKGRSQIEKQKIIGDAKLLEEAGVFSLVIECVKENLAKISAKRKIKTVNCFLNKKNLNYELIAFNKEHSALLQQIKDAFEWGTVPMIFSKEEHLVGFVGGYTDLVSLLDDNEQ